MSSRTAVLRGVVWCGPVLVVEIVALCVGLGRRPQRADDEGTYVAQAWSSLHSGALAHYTYWYDHPPAGWMQLALWFGATGALARHQSAVLAGREAVVTATLAATVLTWLLTRRLGGSPVAATVAAAVFAISPLAVAFHRMVYLDDLAVPWVLLAAVLVTARHRQLPAWAGAAAACAVAVLTKETTVLVVPSLAWVAAQRGHPAVRRTAAGVAVPLFVLLVAVYPVSAAIKDELLPGAGHVSLLGSAWFQVAGREAGGSVLDATSDTARTLASWWSLDAPFVVAGLAAAVLATARQRLRPIAVLVLGHVAVALRPGGYLPVPFVVVLLPFGAVLVALVVEGGLRAWLRHDRRFPRSLTRAMAAGTVLAVVAVGAFWVPSATQGLRWLTTADADRPMRSAERWLAAHVGRHAVVVVDDAMWLDLVRAGRDPDDVVWFHKLDSDPEVRRRTDDGRTVDYVVTTVSVREDLAHLPLVHAAVRRAVLERRFGSGEDRVDVWRVARRTGGRA
ncbi:glycosyltransferase family 39 protein [Curtobacterium sp. MCBD17_035]|uniref:glycosyltransferase family 39 protein n=1 Tax=Curtobacterium sp. MCBD17_035 TaxID=2175673 RepID=UPI0011B5108E|nr:glycosyltransferase family 39 protein [Curtobacterium sp. MCBD17_035]WIB67843.1 glycosyltransferase family 39 protein [Curtobacterium sp. MCBD17_035]